MQNGIPVGLRSSPSFGLSRSGQLTAIIQSLFWDGSQGWWYDDDDLTTLFQDSAGTTPVTAVEQFVGLQLDKSRGLVLGPELVTNGDFSSGTADWTNRSTGTGTFSVSGGAAVVTGIDGTNRGWFTQTRTTVVGVYYKITFDYTHTSGTVNLIFGSAAGTGSLSLTSSGQKTIYLAASSAATFIGFQTAAGGGNGSIDNISVRELPGNHRYAPASGNRPIWSKRVNLLTKTEQFDDAAWVKASVTVTANAVTAPDGTLTADKVIATNTASTTRAVYQNFTASSTASYVFVVYAKASEYTRFALQEIGSGRFGATFDLSTQTTASLGGAGFVSSSITSVGDGWFRCAVTWNGVASTGYALTAIGYPVGVTPSPAGTSYAGDGTSGIFIWGADLRPANQATGLLPLYQRVNTSTDYDTNGFPGYLKADGVDDFLQTNSINFTATDKITLCAGVRKLSDAASAMFAELSVNAVLNTGAFNVQAPVTGGNSEYRYLGGGTTVRNVLVSGYAAPITNVLTGVQDISGDLILLRINGTQVGSTNLDQGTGNLGNYPAYFFRRGGTTLPFNGYEYGNVAVGKLLTADQTVALETYMNGLTKAY